MFFFFNRGIPAGIIFVILNIITVTLIQSLGWNHAWKHCQPYMFDGFKYCFFSPLLGEIIQSDYIIFLRCTNTINWLYHMFVHNALCPGPFPKLPPRRRSGFRSQSSRWHWATRTLGLISPRKLGRKWASKLLLVTWYCWWKLTTWDLSHYLQGLKDQEGQCSNIRVTLPRFFHQCGRQWVQCLIHFVILVSWKGRYSEAAFCLQVLCLRLIVTWGILELPKSVVGSNMGWRRTTYVSLFLFKYEWVDSRNSCLVICIRLVPVVILPN